MLFAKWPRAITTLLLCIFIHAPVTAQSIKAQQQTLAGYEKQLEALQTKQQQLQADLSANKVKLKRLDNRNSPEKDKLKEAKKLLEKTTAEYRSAPTSDNEAKKSNAEFKLALAERRFKKANSRQYKLQEKNDAINDELDAVQNQINKLVTTIANYKKTINRQTQQIATADKAINEQKQRAAEAEIRRLKEELAKQKQRQAQQVQQEATEKELAKQRQLQTQQAASVVAGTKQLALQAAQSTSAAAVKPAVSAPPKTPVASKKSNIASIPAPKGTPAKLLTTRKQVQKEDRRMAKLLTKRTKKRARVNKVLNIKTVSANGTVSKPETHTLRALGREQYKTIVKLKDGDMIFAVGFNNWRQTIPAANGNKEYMIVYDASNAEKPRLLYFDNALTARTRILKK